MKPSAFATLAIETASSPAASATPIAEADRLADTIAVLGRARILARGTADELTASIGAEVLRLQFADAACYQRALGSLDAASTDDRLRVIELATDGSAAEVRAVLGGLEAAGTPAAKVSVHRPSLDDVFRSLTDADATRSETKEMAR